MKFLPIPFLIFSLMFSAIAIKDYFTDKKDTVDIPPRLAMLILQSRGDYESPSVAIENISVDLISLMKKCSSMDQGKTSSDANAEETANICEKNLTSIAKNTNTIYQNFVFAAAQEYFLKKELEKFEASFSKTNYPAVIAFLSLLVSIIAMLPSWIQIVRGKNG